MVTSLLADLLGENMVILDFTDAEHPALMVLPAHRARLAPLLTPETKPEAQAVIRTVVGYRRVLLAIFALTTQGEAGDPAEARRLLAEEYRLADDLGWRLADAVRAQIVRAYQRTTPVCPYCGEIHPQNGDAGVTGDAR